MTLFYLLFTNNIRKRTLLRTASSYRHIANSYLMLVKSNPYLFRTTNGCNCTTNGYIEAILRRYGTTNGCNGDTLRHLGAKLRYLGAILRSLGAIK